jgi:hypothetical protein
MKRISLALLLTAAGIGNASAAGDLIWIYDHDEASGYAGVIAAADKKSEEPHYSILITCSQEDDWAMYISDLDVKALGDTIGKNGQPTFTISSTKAGKTETSEPYYPDISYNQEESRWEYSTIWDIGILDHLIDADQMALKGTGLDAPLPTEGMKDSLSKLKAFCGSLNSGGDSGTPEPNAAP